MTVGICVRASEPQVCAKGQLQSLMEAGSLLLSLLKRKKSMAGVRDRGYTGDIIIYRFRITPGFA